MEIEIGRKSTTIFSIIPSALFMLVFAFIAFPASDSGKQVVEPLTHEAPPRGAETWTDEYGFTCWNKTVCCDESDESSCTSFPVCSDWKKK